MQVFQPAFPFLALCLAASAVLAPPLQIGLAMATVFTCMSQQFHAWAHTKASRLPAAVIALQVSTCAVACCCSCCLSCYLASSCATLH